MAREVNLQGAVAEALTAARAEDLINGVKQAVIAGLQGLDPAAEIHSTEYFNHSVAPDLVLRWTRQGRQDVERSVYLRHTLRSAAAGEDAAQLGALDPVLIALRADPQADQQAEHALSEQLPMTSDMLVTSTASLDLLATEPEAASRGGRHNGPSTASDGAPLFDLIRANLLRAGRGLLVGLAATQLAEQARLPASLADAPQRRALTTSIEDFFAPDAALRLTGAAQLLEFGPFLSRTPTSPTIPGIAAGRPEDIGEDADRLALEASAGRWPELSREDLATVLPSLLRRTDVTDSTAYWARLGSTLSVADLEQLADRLHDVDLTPLVTSNMNVWTAARARLVDFASSYVEQADGWWSIDGRTLTWHTERGRVQVTSDARRLRGRSRGGLPLWPDLAPRLDGLQLTTVAVHGQMRTVKVEARQAANIFEDVEALTNNLDDVYAVQAIDFQAPAVDASAKIHVDFAQHLATAVGRVTVADLAAAALLLM